MSRDDILDTRYGQMIDLINCHAIFSGTANPVNKGKKKLGVMEALAYR